MDGETTNAQHPAKDIKADTLLYRINPALDMARFYRLSIQPTLFGGSSLVRNWRPDRDRGAAEGGTVRYASGSSRSPGPRQAPAIVSGLATGVPHSGPTHQDSKGRGELGIIEGTQLLQQLFRYLELTRRSTVKETVDLLVKRGMLNETIVKNSMGRADGEVQRIWSRRSYHRI